MSITTLLLIHWVIVAEAFDGLCREYLQAGERLGRNSFIGDGECSRGGRRFGLDADGFLGAWTWDNEILWHSGIKGDRLKLQSSDGNLVLYNSTGKPLWATHCHVAGGAVELRSGTESSVISAWDNSENLVWQINNDGQESSCYPLTDEEKNPGIVCKRHILEPGQTLQAEEYICQGSGSQVRFGLNGKGELALWSGREAKWIPPIHENPGQYVIMQRDGNLVYHHSVGDDPNYLRWTTDCLTPNSYLRIENGGVSVVKPNGGISWKVDSNGNESGCNPYDNIEATPPQDVGCTEVSYSGNQCVVQMVDHANVKIVNLQVQRTGSRFLVTDNYDNMSCVNSGVTKEISARLLSDGSLEIDAEVREVTCQDILLGNVLKNSSQLTFIPNEASNCTPFGENIVYFMIMEWFYRG